MILDDYLEDSFEGCMLDNYFFDIGNNNMKWGRVKLRKYVMILEKGLNEWSSVNELYMTDSEKKYRELLDMYYKDREDRMEKMIHSHEVLWLSDKGNVAVAYAREDLGEKYKIYCKAKYGDNSVWEYYNGFGTQGEAMRYASQIYDVEIER